MSNQVDHDTSSSEYLATQEKKWELNRAIGLLNEKDTYLAACMIWDVTETLLITLRERKNKNKHLLNLEKFLREEWQ